MPRWPADRDVTDHLPITNAPIKGIDECASHILYKDFGRSLMESVQNYRNSQHNGKVLDEVELRLLAIEFVNSDSYYKLFVHPATLDFSS